MTFAQAMEMYREVEGSVAAHRLELQDLQRQQADPERIGHLSAHIRDGEKLIQEIQSLELH